MSRELPASVVRTVVPIVVGWLLSLPVTQWLALDEASVTQAVAGVLAAVWYIVFRVVELYVAPKLGAFAIGLGFGAPTYGRHEAGRPVDPPADEGRTHPLLMAGYALAALAVLVAVTLVFAARADARPRPVEHVDVLDVADCQGVLAVTFGLERLDRGGRWVFAQDDGAAVVEIHHLGHGTGPGGQWIRYPATSGGEGRLRIDTGAGIPTWDAVRVRHGGYTSSPGVAAGCPS